MRCILQLDSCSIILTNAFLERYIQRLSHLSDTSSYLGNGCGFLLFYMISLLQIAKMRNFIDVFLDEKFVSRKQIKTSHCESCFNRWHEQSRFSQDSYFYHTCDVVLSELKKTSFKGKSGLNKSIEYCWSFLGRTSYALSFDIQPRQNDIQDASQFGHHWCWMLNSYCTCWYWVYYAAYVGVSLSNNVVRAIIILENELRNIEYRRL